MLFFAAASLAAWIVLLFMRHGFWRGDVVLERSIRPLSAWPAVVAIVPARNEAPTIARCVAALAAQRYDGTLRIIVVDDASTDDTAALGRNAAPADRIAVITAPPLPDGWTGKVAAMSAGVDHAAHIGLAPAYFWFTDADIVHPPETLARLVAKAVHQNRDMVSLMVRLHCVHLWERLLIPAFVFFFQLLYPFRAANDDRSATAAAAGGCVLLRREVLERAGGLAAIRAAIIDDCALARQVKWAGGRLWIGLSDGSTSLREAASLGSLWAMVQRSAFDQLGYSKSLLALAIFGLWLVFVVPPLVVLALPWHGRVGVSAIAAAAWILMTLGYRPTVRYYGQSPWMALLLPAAAILYAAMTIASAVAHWRRRGGLWKGRYYGPSAGRVNLPKSS